MIKNLPKYIFSYLFCFYFLMAGAGFNVVSYCCDTCANKGIESVATSSCFAVHHHNHTKQCAIHDDLTCNDLSHHPENCHLYRINTDIPSNCASISLIISKLAVADFIISKIHYLTSDSELFVWKNNSPPDIAFVQTGRAILTFNGVLLI